ncbi:MAG: MlaE family ABC transporter permease [Thermodesulfobacteriota bacterium]
MQRDSSGLTITPSGDDGINITLPQAINSGNVSSCLKTLKKATSSFKETRVVVDFSRMESFNDFGVIVYMEMENIANTQGALLEFHNIPEFVHNYLDLINYSEFRKNVKAIFSRKTPGFLIRLGEGSIKLVNDFRDMSVFVGEIFICFLCLLFRPGRLRKNDLISYMYQVGVDAVPIVGLISFLLGLIIAFMSSFQLQQFGANIYVASLVSMAMVKELGPIMTCIIVAGRSGSAFAAEIGSMKISEEVDALTTMGFDTILFLVMPKMLAAVIVVPFLVLFSDIFGILGGLTVGVSMLDLTVEGFINQMISDLKIFDFLLGFIKGALFALLISWIGCFRGFQTSGGASQVGASTTSAVVSGIFLIILADSLLAVILQYWG